MVLFPVATPDTCPEASTVATPGVLLVHVPPAEASLNVVIEPTQTVPIPVMLPALGNGLTVTKLVAAAVPQLLVTV